MAKWHSKNFGTEMFRRLPSRSREHETTFFDKQRNKREVENHLSCISSLFTYTSSIFPSRA